jgi:hypothetical protein
MEKSVQLLRNAQAYSQGKGGEDMPGIYVILKTLVEKSYEIQRAYCKGELASCHIASYRASGT